MYHQGHVASAKAALYCFARRSGYFARNMASKDLGSEKTMSTRLCGSVLWAVLFAVVSITKSLGQVVPTNADESTLSDIIVTAQKRSENLQDVPITVSAFTGEDLRQKGIASTGDLATLVSGFVGPGDNGLNAPHIRGIGNAIIAAGNDASVSYYIDDVYIPTTLSGPILLSDVEGVQVLKGPQGTLFGRNATAGAILITTRDPGDSLVAEGTVGYGNYNTTSGSVYVAGPIAPIVSAGLSVEASHQGSPWGINVLDGDPVGETGTNLNVHGKWKFDFSDSTKVMLTGDLERIDAVGMWNDHLVPQSFNTGVGVFPVGGDPWNVSNSFATFSRNKSSGASIKVSQETPIALITSITGYRYAGLCNDYDPDATPLPIEGLVSCEGSHQFSEELQLTSQRPGPFQWTTGIFYFKSTDSFNGIVSIPLEALEIPIDAKQNTDSIAGFVQPSYTLPTDTRLTAGFRYTSETRHASPEIPDATTQHVTADVATWRVSADQKLTEQESVYIAASRGFKSGGFNLTSVENQPFKPEFLKDYEIGSKSELFNKRLRLNAAAFYYDYTDIQITAQQPGGLETLYNAAAAKEYGLDVDFEAQVTKEFVLSGSAEGLHSKYTNFPNAEIYQEPPQGGVVSTTGSADGNQLLQAPKFTGSMSADYKLPSAIGQWALSTTYSYNSGYFATPGNEFRQGAFGLLSSSIRWDAPFNHLWVRLWGKNLTDRFTYNVLTFGPVGPTGFANAPRTYGITIGYNL